MNIEFGEIQVVEHSRKIEKDKIKADERAKASMIIYEHLYFELYSKMVQVLGKSKPVFFDVIKTDIKEYENEYEYIVYCEYRFKK
jgi:hypothetical protein